MPTDIIIIINLLFFGGVYMVSLSSTRVIQKKSLSSINQIRNLTQKTKMLVKPANHLPEKFAKSRVMAYSQNSDSESIHLTNENKNSSCNTNINRDLNANLNYFKNRNNTNSNISINKQDKKTNTPSSVDELIKGTFENRTKLINSLIKYEKGRSYTHEEKNKAISQLPLKLALEAEKATFNGFSSAGRRTLENAVPLLALGKLLGLGKYIGMATKNHLESFAREMSFSNYLAIVTETLKIIESPTKSNENAKLSV